MGIDWLSYYTHTEDGGALRAHNEERSAAFHARWRSLCGRFGELADRVRERRLVRASRRELDRLPDAVLRDIGLWRDAVGSIGVAPREWRRTSDQGTAGSLPRRPPIGRVASSTDPTTGWAPVSGSSTPACGRGSSVVIARFARRRTRWPWKHASTSRPRLSSRGRASER